VLRQTQKWGIELKINKSWKEGYSSSRTLFDRTVAIHGFGRITRKLLLLLKPFRTKVFVFSEGVPHDFIQTHGAQPLPSLEALCACGADLFFELEALTSSTRGSLNKKLLATLKPGSVFINCGRGAVVDESALSQVASEHNLHLGLDVYAVEPPAKDSPLRTLMNATLMPHQGGPTPDIYPQCASLALDNLENYLAGKPLLSELSLTDYDRST
jgi:phosphoglycerate dehydrogenase-like enzyme